MLKNCANMSQQECQRAESFGDRISNLHAIIGCLNLADDCCKDEGILLTGTLKEMAEQVNLIIRQLEDDYLEG